MNVLQSVRQILNRRIVARDQKRNFEILERMTDRELNDIGLPREYLYADSANQRRHAPCNNPSQVKGSPEHHAA
ncbi:MAG: DUF1127 domain-containing protein [Granulosicoccus sp.]